MEPEHNEILTRLTKIHEILLRQEALFYYQLGQQYFQNKALESALTCYEQCLATNHPFYKIWALTALGDVYKELDDSDKVKQCYQRIVDADAETKNLTASSVVGFAYTQLGRYAEAASWFRKSVEFNPRDPSSKLNLIENLILTGKYDHVEDLLAETVQLTENVPGLYLVSLFLSCVLHGLRNNPSVFNSYRDKLSNLISKGAYTPPTWSFNEIRPVVQTSLKLGSDFLLSLIDLFEGRLSVKQFIDRYPPPTTETRSNQ